MMNEIAKMDVSKYWCLFLILLFFLFFTGCGQKQELKKLGIKDANFDFKIDGTYEGYGSKMWGKHNQRLKVSFKLSNTGKLLELSWEDANNLSNLTSQSWEANGQRNFSMEIRSTSNRMWYVSKKVSLSYDGKTLKGSRTTKGHELKDFRFSVNIPEKNDSSAPSLIYDPKTKKLFLEFSWTIPSIKEFQAVDGSWYFLLNESKVKEYNKFLKLFSKGNIVNKSAYENIMAKSPIEYTPHGLTVKGKTNFMPQQTLTYRLEKMAYIPAYAVGKKKESVMKMKIEGARKTIKIEISKNGNVEFISDRKISCQMKKKL